MDEPSRGAMWTCPRCSERIVPPATTCWKCGGGPEGLPEEEPAVPAPRPSLLDQDVEIPLPAPGRMSRPAIACEILAVLCIGVLPFLDSAIWSLIAPKSTLSFSQRRFKLALESIMVIIPILYIIWRSGEVWSHFGLARPVWRADAITCGLLFLLFLGSDTLLWPSISRILPHSGYTPQKASGAAERVFLIAVALLTSFEEELVMRGYLMTRLETLLRSTGGSILWSALLFGSYHLYQGLAGAVAAGSMGLLFGAAFAVVRRVWPLALAHALFNILVGW